MPAITVVWSPSSHVQLHSRISRRLPPAPVIFFAAAVMNVRRPECEEAPSNPDLSESGAKPHRKGIGAVAGSALAVDDRKVLAPQTGFVLTSAAPRSL